MYTLKRATMEMLYIHASLKPISVPKSKFLYYLRCLKKKKKSPKKTGKTYCTHFFDYYLGQGKLRSLMFTKFLA